MKLSKVAVLLILACGANVAFADATGAALSKRSPASGNETKSTTPNPPPVGPSGPVTGPVTSGVNSGLAAGAGVVGGAVKGGGCGKVASCPEASSK